MNKMDNFTKKIREKYIKVRNLVDEESKDDPETEPFKSRLVAQPILLEMRDSLSEILNSSNLDDSLFQAYLGMLLVVTYEIGLNFAETEDPTEAKKFYKETMEMIPDPLSPDYIVLAIQSRNQYAIILHESDRKHCEKWLEEADQMYFDYKKKYPDTIPKHGDDHFRTVESFTGDKELMRVHTLTKFYMAQIYGVKKEYLKSAYSCYETLRLKSVSDEVDLCDFAVSSSSLGQYFLDKFNFKQSRYLFCVSEVMLKRSVDLLKDMSFEEREQKVEELSYRRADLARCWSRYAILLLQYSTELISEPGKVYEEDPTVYTKFETLDVSEFERQVTDTEVKTFDEAREVFLFGQKRVNEAKEYFRLEDSASDHALTVQDHSQLFKYLMMFEPDPVRQCKYLRRRIDMLEPMADALNPTHYMPLCRAIWFEIGECYHKILCLKFDRVREPGDGTTPDEMKKINLLIVCSMTQFFNVLNSYRDYNGELPDPIPKDAVSHIVLSHFYLGRMYYAYVTPDIARWTENAYRAYYYLTYVVDVCEEDERAREVAHLEYVLCKPILATLKKRLTNAQRTNSA